MERASKYVRCMELFSPVIHTTYVNEGKEHYSLLDIARKKFVKIFVARCFLLRLFFSKMDWKFVDMHAIDLSRPKKGPRQDFENFQMLLLQNFFFYIACG
jgi:hypothetical protein